MSLELNQQIEIIKAEIENLKNQQQELEQVIKQYEESLNKGFTERSTANWNVHTKASLIKESGVLSKRDNYHIVKMSSRSKSHSVIKRSYVIGKDFCEFEAIASKLFWEEAKQMVLDHNQ